MAKDKVVLLKRHLKVFEYENHAKGHYEGGIFIPGETTTETFKGITFSIDGDTLKIHPEGTFNADDKVLYTKKDLNNVDSFIILKSTGTKYRIFNEIEFDEMADLRIYLIMKVEKNG